jgi:CubicO group peptidase (beta-lactamase class C family)
MIKRIWFGVVTLCVVFSGWLAASQEAVDLAGLEAYFDQARQEWRIPGMAVAIVKDGEVVLAKGYGVRDINGQESVDEQTLFAIASNTKAFTAASLAMLVAEERIDWDDKVREYLPYFKLYDPYVTEAVTIRDLLCHRVGLRTFSGDLLWYETGYSTAEVIRRARCLKPTYGFRDGYGYSNIMFMAAGEVVAVVSGKSWNRFVTERIFEPLGMTATHIGTSGLKQYDNVATPHHVPLAGKTVTVAYTVSDQIAAAGGINANVSDMARWLQMLLAGGKFRQRQILSPEGIGEMWSMHNIIPVSPAAQELFPSTHFRGYGLGWALLDYHGHKIINHGGGLDGMVSRVALVPEIDLGLVILTNSINGLPTALMYRIIDAYQKVEPRDWSRIFLERYRKRVKRDLESPDIKEREIAVPKKCRPPMEDFVGLYEDTMYGSARVSRDKDHLVLELLPAPVFVSDLYYFQYDTFRLKLRNTFSFIPSGRGTVQFFRDNQGRVTEMTIDIPNRDFLFSELTFNKKRE